MYGPGCFVCTESEVVVNMLACMYRLLSTCWLVCAVCCQHVGLYMQFVVNMLACMYRLLSTCWLVCTDCCQHVGLYVQTVVNMLACMYRLLSTCWLVCAVCCQHVGLYVQVVVNMLTCTCISCVHTNIRTSSVVLCYNLISHYFHAGVNLHNILCGVLCTHFHVILCVCAFCS